MRINKQNTYSDEEILMEIQRVHASVDLMEEFMDMYCNQYNSNAISHFQSDVSAPVSFKGRVIRKAYRIIKRGMERTGISVLVKKTRLFKILKSKGIIFKLNNGQF